MTGQSIRTAIKKQDYAAVAVLVGVTAFLLWRAPYGFAFWDESWYLTFGHRFSMGDSLLTDEWNVIQLFSFFLHLPVKVYLLLTGSTEGIHLAFRHMFLLFHATVSLAVYLLIRKQGPISVFVLLMYALFVPLGIFAVSYYSLAVAFSVLIGLLLAFTGLSRWTSVLIGVLFAGLVLANPFMAVLFFLYVLLVVGISVRSKTAGLQEQPFGLFWSSKTALWITLGISVLAAIFLLYLLSRTSVRDIAANFPHLFEDSDYNLVNAAGEKQNIFSLKETVTNIININPYLLAIYGILLTVMFIDKRRHLHAVYYFVGVIGIILGFFLYFARSSEFYNYLFNLFPLALLGPVCYSVTRNRNKRVFFSLWVWGIVVAFFEDIASNQGVKLMSLGLICSAIAGVFLAKDLHDESGSRTTQDKKAKKSAKRVSEKKIIAVAFVAVMIAQISFQCFTLVDFRTISAEYFYHNDIGFSVPHEDLEVVLEKGPAKGLITTKTVADKYTRMLSDLSYVRNQAEGPLLIMGRYPWGYLYAEKPYATYTTAYLIFKVPETMERLAKYYALHEDKIPQYIYVPETPTLFISGDFWQQYYELTGIDMSEQALTMIKNTFRCEITKGEAGYLLKNLDYRGE